MEVKQANAVLHVGPVCLRVGASSEIELPVLHEGPESLFWDRDGLSRDATLFVQACKGFRSSILSERPSSVGGWEYHQLPEGRYLYRDWRRADGGFEAHVVVDATGTEWNVYLEGSRDDGRHPYFGPLVKLIMTELLAGRECLVVHASAVLLNGRTYVFLGQDGAGKSTLARLFKKHAGAVILNDDHVVLGQAGLESYAYGTFWGNEGSPCCPQGAPLEALFFLVQGTIDQVHPLAKAQAARRALPCTFMPHWRADLVAPIIPALDRLLSRIPCYELVFTPTSGAVECVLSLKKA